MKTNELRQTFLKYFEERDHQIVPTSSLVPSNDQSLLFTNAGMVQFKETFLGRERRPYLRAVTAQRCVRAGGKHNDLENVGYTARHHTFFEMLGNFSFGDYFKREAIGYCWELMTERLGLPKERLWVTVFEDDDEAADIWLKELGVDPRRFSRCGEKDNFWAMGDTGPCGPCSEVFYDHGPEIPGGPPGSPDEDGDRYIELWNLVFMQYDRGSDGTLSPLPKPSVDTGMGLERMAAVLQGVHSNYEIDLFEHLIKATAEVVGAADTDDKSLRVIADHIRSCSFLVADGVVPSNTTRGYVLRRIIRRAIRHGHRLGVAEPFFYKLVEPLEKEMGGAYPELVERRGFIEQVLQDEEERFADTLDRGMKILNDELKAVRRSSKISGELVFKLYDTYGFPSDLTADIARERGLSVDHADFERRMEEQRRRSQDEDGFRVDATKVEGRSEFVGYERLVVRSRVAGLLLIEKSTDGKVLHRSPVARLEPEDEGIVVMEVTPFYAESGGQVGDRGILKGEGGISFEVADTQRVGDAVAHVGVVTDGIIDLGSELTADVDAQARLATARNHSATHLLHAALRSVLGPHVHQEGSLVEAERLRFDFSHPGALSEKECTEIETLVNRWIWSNDDAVTQVMPLEDAKKSGAIALFDEKYDDPVRVLSIGNYSTELCGGTHIGRSGDIGLFKVTSESGIAAGVRRIEAVTGSGALQWVRETDRHLQDAARRVKSDRGKVTEKLDQLLARNRELEKQLDRLRNRLAASQGEDLAAQAIDVDGLKVLAARVDGVDPKGLRNTVDQLKNKLGTAAVVLATVSGDEKVKLVAGVTSDLTDRIEAGRLANFVAQQVGGRGGGRADLAEAGGTDPARLDQAIKSVANWVRERMAS